MLLGKDREMMNTLLGESKGLGRIAQRYRYNSDPDRMYKDYALTQQQQALQGLKGKIPEEVMQMYQAGMLPPDAIGNMMGFGGSDAPANVREWHHYSQLPQDQQRQYLEMKRASQMMNLGNQFAVRDPVSNQAAPIPGGQIQLAPNETMPYQYGASASRAQGEADVRGATAPDIERRIAEARLAAQAEAEQDAKARHNSQNLAVYEATMQGLVESLTGIPTGPGVGWLPALTTGQQIAEGAIATMRPIIKAQFKLPGEGAWTDRDQKQLDDMLPTRKDTQEAIAWKLQALDTILRRKMGGEPVNVDDFYRAYKQRFEAPQSAAPSVNQSAIQAELERRRKAQGQ